MNKESLIEMFNSHFAVLWGDGTVEDLLNVVHDQALIIAEDTPFVFSKLEFAEHMDFHMSGIWERFAWKPRDVSYLVIGNSGLITGNFSIHGKPKDAGYRQRDGMFSVVCDYDSTTGHWKVLKFHCSSLFSAIHHSSPG